MPLLSTLASGSARGFGQGLAVEEDQSETLTGVASIASLGSVSAVAGALISVSGISASGAVGSANATGGSEAIPVSGVAGTATVGSASASLSVSAAVQGQGVTASIGIAQSAITKTNLIYDVSGVGATASVGSSTVNIPITGVTVNLTGVSGTSAVGIASASVPPEAQYFATMYIYPGSLNVQGQDVQFWRWNPSTNSVTFTGGASSGGAVTSMTNAAKENLGGNTMAATKSINGSNQWLIYTIAGGTTSTRINLYRMSTTGTLSASRATAYTEFSAGSPTYSWGRSLSIGYSDQRLAFAWTGSTTVASIPRVFSLDKNQSTASATLSLISPIAAPATSTSYTYHSAAVHPTENTVVLVAQETSAPYNRGRVYLYRNYGVSGSEVQTLYTVTGTLNNTLSIFGYASAWSHSGDYLVVVDGARYDGGSFSGSRLYLYSYDGSTLSLTQEIDVSFSDAKIVWGPSDGYTSYLLCGGEGNLYSFKLTGNTFNPTPTIYPNAQQNSQMALNYNASALFGPTDWASDNTNMRVFLMDPSGDGDVSSLAVSQQVSMSSDPSGFAHYYGVVSLPPLED